MGWNFYWNFIEVFPKHPKHPISNIPAMVQIIATSHYLNQWWLILLMHIFITWPQWVNSLLPNTHGWCQFDVASPSYTLRSYGRHGSPGNVDFVNPQTISNLIIQKSTEEWITRINQCRVVHELDKHVPKEYRFDWHLASVILHLSLQLCPPYSHLNTFMGEAQYCIFIGDEQQSHFCWCPVVHLRKKIKFC